MVDFDVKALKNLKPLTGSLFVWEDEWKGQPQVHIRSIYKKDDKFLPGKGVALPKEQFEEFMAALTDWATSPNN